MNVNLYQSTDYVSSICLKLALRRFCGATPPLRRLIDRGTSLGLTKLVSWYHPSPTRAHRFLAFSVRSGTSTVILLLALGLLACWVVDRLVRIVTLQAGALIQIVGTILA